MDNPYAQTYGTVSRPDEWNGLGHLVVICVFPTLATIAVALRIYTRVFIVHKFCLEDYLLVIGHVLSLGVAIGQSIEMVYGVGKHSGDVTYANHVKISKAIYSTVPCYFLSLALTKLSVILLYLRICKKDVIPRRICYAMIAITIISVVALMPPQLFYCYPIRYFWDSAAYGPHCLNNEAVFLAPAYYNVFADFVLLVFPVVILRHLTLPMVQRMTVIGILSFGGVVCIASILRLRALYIILHSKDVLWDCPHGSLSACVENHVGIICASVSTLRPLAAKLFPHVTFKRVDASSERGIALISDTNASKPGELTTWSDQTATLHETQSVLEKGFSKNRTDSSLSAMIQ